VTVGPDLTFNGPNDAFVAKIVDTPIVGASFYTLAPCRVLDTRDSPGPYGGPALAAGETRTFMIRGRCGIPPTANAISSNLTVALPTVEGFLTTFPGGTSAPLASTINYRAGQVRANNAIMRLGTDGSLAVYCGQGAGSLNVILDVNGYYQ
jgi:hypothetical protein